MFMFRSLDSVFYAFPMCLSCLFSLKKNVGEGIRRLQDILQYCLQKVNDYSYNSTFHSCVDKSHVCGRAIHFVANLLIPSTFSLQYRSRSSQDANYTDLCPYDSNEAKVKDAACKFVVITMIYEAKA